MDRHEKERKKRKVLEKIKSQEYSVALKSGEPNKKSNIWQDVYQIFEKDEKGNPSLVKSWVQCKKCEEVMEYNSKNGTNQIKGHTKKHEKISALNGQPSITNFIRNIDTKPNGKFVSSESKTDLTKTCVNFVAEDLRSFETVAGSGFVKLASMLWNLGAAYGKIDEKEMNTVLPSGRTVSRHVKIEGEAAKATTRTILAEIIKKCWRIGLTSDVWMDDYKRISYLSMTVHFFHKNVLHDEIIALRPLPIGVKKDHILLRRIMNEILREHGLLEHIDRLVLVTDRGGNIRLALPEVIRLNCFPHFLNNIVDHVCENPTVKGYITDCKALVKYFKFGLNNLLSTTLKSAVSTRFNSVCIMIESILNNWDDVTRILAERKQECRIENIDFDYLQIIYVFLEKFRFWKDETEGSSKPTLSKVWVGIVDIQRHLQPQIGDTEMEEQMKKVGSDYINKEFVLHDYHKVATFLNPHFKSLKFASESEIKSTIEIVSGFVGIFADRPNVSMNTSNATNDTSANSSPSPLLDWIDDEERSEIDEYLHYKVPRNEQIDLFSWWIERKNIFPNLSKIGIFIHSVPGGSTASERKFSVAGNILTDKRSNLDPAQVERLMILNSKFADKICNENEDAEIEE